MFSLHIVFVLLLWFGGVYLLCFRNPRTPKLRDRANAAWRDLKKSEMDAVFQAAGIPLSLRKYNLLRLMTLYAFLVIAVPAYIAGGLQSALIVMGLGAVLYGLSWPGDGCAKTPFKYVLDRLSKNYKRQKDEELMIVIMQLKNIIIAQQNRPWGADYILQSIMRFSKITKPIFAHTISLMRLGQEQEAYHYFGGAFGTRLGNQFATIILKMDYLDPAEFMDQLNIFQTQIKETRKTERKRRQELTSTVMFSLASVEVLLVVTNFVIMIINWALGQMVI